MVFRLFFSISLFSTLFFSLVASASDTTKRLPDDFGGKVSPFIAGGEDVPEGERLYSVALLDGIDAFCSGALIGDYWVLTAAHCVDDMHINRLRVRMGSTDSDSHRNVTREAHKAFIHPGYELQTGSKGEIIKIRNDIALLHLKSAAPARIPRLKLANEVITLLTANPGNEVTVSGWGLLQLNLDLADILQQLTLPVVSVDRCVSDDSSVFGAQSQWLCMSPGATRISQGTCLGDSGGPVTVRYIDEDYKEEVYSVGVNSWMIADPLCGDSVSAAKKTSHYYDWIKTFTSKPSGHNCVWRFSQTVNAGHYDVLTISTPIGSCNHNTRIHSRRHNSTTYN